MKIAPLLQWIKAQTERVRCAALGLKGRDLAAAVLWLCVLGVVWLQPMAMRRRALEARLENAESRLAVEEAVNAQSSQYRTALQNDPMAVDRAARALGYGKPGERVYTLTEKERRAADALLGRGPVAQSDSWLTTAGKAMAPAFMILIAGVAAVLFFTGLKVEDHLDG